ncbi:hypothetical protein K470DRAFT_256084 [Piedraia hortae CBS 480.64]|uniref:Nucleolar protein 16 n=1 Tax=Piedraia hortae CBS 480.64 TaxID=1314780 RepID=A0A6A7C4Z6_9PEZI|nr:hypothetical protein K470DRAFT_256084 [Piedraia hortae CBS 480.64]
MGRELQKRKNRSSISKVRRKPKSKKKIIHNAIVAQGWDKSQTLAQNYERIGLAVKLNKHVSAGATAAEKAKRTAPLAIKAKAKSDHIEVKEAKVERDPETGEIVRVVETKKFNPLNDILNSDDESDKEEPQAVARTDIVRELEKEADRPATRYKRKQSENEKQFIAELVAKHGQDYTAMARDIKINYMQRSEGDLKRRVRLWESDGGN